MRELRCRPRSRDEACARSYDDNVPYTPRWQESITGVEAAKVIDVARQFARTAEKTKGRSMIIIGAGVNHWYHQDMIYRSAINMLMLCGCVGVSGGGGALRRTGKLRPQTAAGLAFATDWCGRLRHINGTLRSLQPFRPWRYREDRRARASIAARRCEALYRPISISMCRSERWDGCLRASARNQPAQGGERRGEGAWNRRIMSCRPEGRNSQDGLKDPDDPANYPRNLFLWRSNRSARRARARYMLRHLMGRRTA